MKTCEEWWNSVKDSPCWSGAIVGLAWHELWESARSDVRKIWEAL
jgi:hypothetical protein